jgi:hypothetical protein
MLAHRTVLSPRCCRPRTVRRRGCVSRSPTKWQVVAVHDASGGGSRRTAAWNRYTPRKWLRRTLAATASNHGRGSSSGTSSIRCHATRNVSATRSSASTPTIERWLGIPPHRRQVRIEQGAKALLGNHLPTDCPLVTARYHRIRRNEGGGRLRWRMMGAETGSKSACRTRTKQRRQVPTRAAATRMPDARVGMPWFRVAEEVPSAPVRASGICPCPWAVSGSAPPVATSSAHWRPARLRSLTARPQPPRHAHGVP